MPNHVTTKLKVHGSSVDRFVETCISTDEKGKTLLDFSAAIPMPETLEIESGTNTELGMYYLVSKALRYVEMPSWLQGREITEEAIELGKKALMNIAQHGQSTWYDWRIDNWGTKWNSYAFSETDRSTSSYECEFQTAWSFPVPVFDRLAEMFPDLIFETISFDEGWNFAARGRWENGTGELVELEATEELYEEVYGEPYIKDDEE